MYKRQLMITAKGSFDDMRQGFFSGSDDYMVKPVNVNETVSYTHLDVYKRQNQWYGFLGNIGTSTSL